MLSGWASIILVLSLFFAVCAVAFSIGAAVDDHRSERRRDEWWNK